MVTETVNDWGDLARLVERFQTEAWIFRGVTDAEYSLVPTIGRPGARVDFDGKDLPYSADAERGMLERFKREARPHLLVEPKGDLEWRSVAQHHGLATRLLDWSESPLIAGYFAVKPGGFRLHQHRLERRDAALFGLPCPRVAATEKEYEETGEVVAYYPQHLTSRIPAQRGLFTVHKEPDRAWQPADLYRWVIPSGSCMNIKAALNRAGLNEASLFPGLDGLAGHVNWLHKWNILGRA